MGTKAAALALPALMATALLLSTAFFPSASAASSYPATASTAVAGRSMVRYEGGYAVDTVFDGSKLGIEPHAVEVTPAGDLLVLDSINSNIYRAS
nr:unnamed protein product [Digitaria exilis]